MSNQIFKWMPQLLDYTTKQAYSTIISTFENGIEQRRMRSQRPIGSWKFNYSSLLISPETANKVGDEIFDFFNSMDGAYDNFFLPSWELEVRSTSATSGQKNISLGAVPTSLGFSAVMGAQGNYVYICKDYCLHPNQTMTHEIGRIASISGETIVLESNISGEYSGVAKIQKAHLVRFVTDELERSHKLPYVWESPIEFIEDIGGIGGVVI